MIADEFVLSMAKEYREKAKFLRESLDGLKTMEEDDGLIYAEQIADWLTELVARRNGDSPIFHDRRRLADVTSDTLDSVFDAETKMDRSKYIHLYWALFELLGIRSDYVTMENIRAIEAVQQLRAK